MLDVPYGTMMLCNLARLLTLQMNCLQFQVSPKQWYIKYLLDYMAQRPVINIMDICTSSQIIEQKYSPISSTTTCSKSLKIVPIPNPFPDNQANTAFLRPMLGNGKKAREQILHENSTKKTFSVNVKEA
jgi:hypothetical protein